MYHMWRLGLGCFLALKVPILRGNCSICWPILSYHSVEWTVKSRRELARVVEWDELRDSGGSN